MTVNSVLCCEEGIINYILLYRFLYCLYFYFDCVFSFHFISFDFSSFFLCLSPVHRIEMNLMLAEYHLGWNHSSVLFVCVCVCVCLPPKVSVARDWWMECTMLYVVLWTLSPKWANDDQHTGDDPMNGRMCWWWCAATVLVIHGRRMIT